MLISLLFSFVSLVLFTTKYNVNCCTIVECFSSVCEIKTTGQCILVYNSQIPTKEKKGTRVY